MKLRHVRHATSLLEYAGINILIDPLLAEKSTYPPIPMTPKQRRNPLVELRTSMEEILNVDMIFVTHYHPDHFDEKAKEVLDRTMELVCQVSDVKTFQNLGFTHVTPVKTSVKVKDISITKVDAQHGTGLIGKLMGTSSGYILAADGEPTVYLTGDTIYNESVKKTIGQYQPDVLIINAGSPKFLFGKPIVNNIKDVEAIMSVDPKKAFVLVHLDAYNHCVETREDVRNYFSESKLDALGVQRFYVPEDNQTLVFS